MTNHTLEKPNNWCMTPLTFGNHLKFGPDSYHNAKGRPTFLHQEREHPKLRMNHTHSSRGASNKPCAHESCCHGGWLNKGPWRRQFFAVVLRSRPNIDKVPNTFLSIYLNSEPISLVVRSKVLREDAIYMVPWPLQKLSGDSPCVRIPLAYLKASTYSRTDLRIQIAQNSIDRQLLRRYQHM